MTDRKQQEREHFIQNRVYEDWRALCQEPKVCGKSMLPAWCDLCGWNSDTAHEDAEQAADRLEAKDK